jgi:hypothetical protein
MMPWDFFQHRFRLVDRQCASAEEEYHFPSHRQVFLGSRRWPGTISVTSEIESEATKSG